MAQHKQSILGAEDSAMLLTPRLGGQHEQIHTYVGCPGSTQENARIAEVFERSGETTESEVGHGTPRRTLERI